MLFAADEKKPGAKPPATSPATGPTDADIAKLIAEQLGLDSTSEAPLLLAMDLARDHEVMRLRHMNGEIPDQIDPQLVQAIQAWLAKQPARTLTVPPALLTLDPKLQEKVDAGYGRMRAHYKEHFAALEKYLEEGPDPVAESERRLLELMKRARQYREAKIRELDAARMAAEAARRRTGVPPAVSRELLASRADLTSLEQALHRYNVKLYTALTEYYRNDTELRRENKFPKELLAVWAADTKILVTEAEKKADQYAFASNDVEGEFYEWTMIGRRPGDAKFPPKIATPAGVYLVNWRVARWKEARSKLGDLAALKPTTPALAPTPAPGPNGNHAGLPSPEVLLTQLQKLRRSTEKETAQDHAYFYYKMSRGQLIIPPGDDRANAAFLTIEQPWVTALAWYRRELTEKARAAGRAPAPLSSAQTRATTLRQRLGFELPATAETKPEKPNPPGRRRGMPSALKWAAAVGLGLGATFGGARWLGPHVGFEIPIPFSSPFSSSNPYAFADTPAVGQNYDATEPAKENEVPRPRYLLEPGTETRLGVLPTEFEFAYLNERHQPLTEYRFVPREVKEPVFKLNTEKLIRARDGWIAVAKTGGYDNQVIIKSGDRVLVEGPGKDYQIFVTQSGALIAKMSSANSNVALHVSNRYFRQNTAPNPIPEKELHLNPEELNRLLTQADYMDKEGLTVWAKSLRERVELAKNGSPLKVTELADILARGTFYPEKASGIVQTAKPGSPWSTMRDLPRDEGKLVGQCSVSKDALSQLINAVAPRFRPWIYSMSVETRDANSPMVGKTYGHTYLVLKPPSYDPMPMDATSGTIHPKYAMPEEVAEGFRMPWHSLGVGAGVLALAGAGWYLRRKLRTLTPKEELEAKRELEEAKLAKADRGPASAVPKPPTPEEIEREALRARNARRRERAARLEKLADRAVTYGDSFGADPGRRDRTLPLPTVAHAARLLREYLLGQTEYDTEDKMARALADVFHLDAEQRALAGNSVAGVLKLGQTVVASTRQKYLAIHPDAIDSADLGEPLFKELEATLKFINAEHWTPYEREPLATGPACPLGDLAPPKSG